MVNKKRIRRRQRRFRLQILYAIRNGLVYGFEVRYNNPPIPSYQCPASYFKDRKKRENSLRLAPANILPDDIDIDTLVNLGYYHSAKNEICCFSCGFKLTQCDVFNDPLVDHLRKHPNCEHLKQHEQIDVLEEILQGMALSDANDSSASETSDPAEESAFSGRMYSPYFKTERARLASFKYFKSTSGVTPASLAKAGFFYTGTGDTVRCFSCDIGLCYWEPGDVPWLEHAKYSPKCPYILYIKGRDNILNTRTSKTPDKQSTAAKDVILTEDTMCKVCFVNAVCIVFLPCGHLVTCAECAPALRKCPICRSLVKGTVRAFFP